MADKPTTTQTISTLTEKDADSVKDIDIMILEDNEDTKKITFSSVAKVLLERIKNSVIDFDDTQTSDELVNITSGELLPSLFCKIKKAIDKLISHIENKENPHEVTGDQINLSSENVESAIGYTPANQSNVDQLETDINKINSMELTGRNLQLGTQYWDKSAFLSGDTSDVNITGDEVVVTSSSCPCSSIQVETSQHYTISVDIKSDIAYTSPTYGFSIALFSKNGTQETQEFVQVTSLNTEFSRFSYTLKIPSGITSISVELLNGSAIGIVMSYRHLKVEKGINVTEYLPALEDTDKRIVDISSQIGDLDSLTTTQKDSIVNAINEINSSSSTSLTTEIQPVINAFNYGNFEGGYVQIGHMVCVHIEVMLSDDYYAGNSLCIGLPDPVDGYAIVNALHGGTMAYSEGNITGGTLFVNMSASVGNFLYINGSYLSR